MFLVDNLKSRIGKVAEASTLAVHIALIVGVAVYTVFGALTMQWLESPERLKAYRSRETRAVPLQPPPVRFEEKGKAEKFVKVYLGDELALLDGGVHACLTHVISNVLTATDCNPELIEQIDIGNIDRCYEMAKVSKKITVKAGPTPTVETRHTVKPTGKNEQPQKMTIEEEIQRELDKWNFGNALIFAFTLITTIGYGHVAPETFYGRLFCLIYGLIGVPLTLLTIADLGMFLMKVIRIIIAHIRKWLAVIHKLLFFKKSKKVEMMNNSNGICDDSVVMTTAREKDDDDAIKETNEEEVGEEEETGEEEPQEDPRKTEESIALGLTFAFYLFIGAKVLSLYEEEMDFFRALYFNFVTLTTIGLGDIVPRSHDYLLLTLIYIGIGLALTTVAIEIAADLLKKIHYAGRKMENMANAVVWFGGKKMTMKALVKNLGDKFNIPQEEMVNFNFDQFVDNAIKVEKGELQTLRKPPSPVVFRDPPPRALSYSNIRKSNESSTIKYMDERFSKATDLSTVTEDASIDFILSDYGSKPPNSKGNRSAKERQRHAVPPLELDIPFLTDSSMPNSFDIEYLQTFTYSKR